MDLISLRRITNEHRLFKWFINEYTEYYDFHYNMLAKAHAGEDKLILFLYSCDDIVVFRQDGSWEVFGCYSEPEQENWDSETVYKMRELADNIIFREELRQKFPHPFIIEYTDKGVTICW